jgi:hypothetical protein
MQEEHPWVQQSLSRENEVGVKALWCLPSWVLKNLW